MIPSLYDYKKFAVLYVEDEEKSLSISRALRQHFTIYTASNAIDGFRLLEQHKDETA